MSDSLSIKVSDGFCGPSMKGWAGGSFILLNSSFRVSATPRHAVDGGRGRTDIRDCLSKASKRGQSTLTNPARKLLLRRPSWRTLVH